MNGAFLSSLFELNYSVLFRNLEGISHADSLIEPSPAGNCINWVLGHMVATRNRLLQFVREEPIWPREQAFLYSGLDGAGWSPERALPIDVIRTDLVRSQQQILGALHTLTDRELATAVDESRSLRDAIAFFHFHESYHAGQIALLRRIAGKPGVIKPPRAT